VVELFQLRAIVLCNTADLNPPPPLGKRPPCTIDEVASEVTVHHTAHDGSGSDAFAETNQARPSICPSLTRRSAELDALWIGQEDGQSQSVEPISGEKEICRDQALKNSPA
jgi:hypothetical protein